MTVEQARAEAIAILDARDESKIQLRTCWNCNASHEYLKGSSLLIKCFACGCWYFMGFHVCGSASTHEAGGNK